MYRIELRDYEFRTTWVEYATAVTVDGNTIRYWGATTWRCDDHMNGPVNGGGGYLRWPEHGHPNWERIVTEIPAPTSPGGNGLL
jgi:hypothetical protein